MGRLVMEDLSYERYLTARRAAGKLVEDDIARKHWDSFDRGWWRAWISDLEEAARQLSPDRSQQWGAW